MGGVVFCAGLEVASDVSEYGEMGVLPVHAGQISFFAPLRADEDLCPPAGHVDIPFYVCYI